MSITLRKERRKSVRGARKRDEGRGEPQVYKTGRVEIKREAGVD